MTVLPWSLIRTIRTSFAITGLGGKKEKRLQKFEKDFRLLTLKI